MPPLRRACPQLRIGVVVIQIIPYGRNHTNPSTLAEPLWDSPQTRALFMRSCGDCHSNETIWPWYSNIAPFSWLVQRDVDEGRARFNISTWGRGENEGEDAAETLQKGSMPPKIYLLIQPDARLSDSEKQALVEGLIATFGGEKQGGETGNENTAGDDD